MFFIYFFLPVIDTLISVHLSAAIDDKWIFQSYKKCETLRLMMLSKTTTTTNSESIMMSTFDLHLWKLHWISRGASGPGLMSETPLEKSSHTYETICLSDGVAAWHVPHIVLSSIAKTVVIGLTPVSLFADTPNSWRVKNDWWRSASCLVSSS